MMEIDNVEAWGAVIRSVLHAVPQEHRVAVLAAVKKREAARGLRDGDADARMYADVLKLKRLVSQIFGRDVRAGAARAREVARARRRSESNSNRR
jgi:hypothetical protein